MRIINLQVFFTARQFFWAFSRTFLVTELKIKKKEEKIKKLKLKKKKKKLN